MDFEEKEIEIVSLELDVNNPRHPNKEKQIEIYSWMLDGNKNIGEKLFNLAKDIVAHGTNPAEKVIVTPKVDDPETFTVIEGNRRVTALNLLHNPNIAPTEKWRKKFRDISSKLESKIKAIPCIIFYDIEKAFHFIELKHMGPQNGAGTVPWDSEQKARHDLRASKKAKNNDALKMLDFIRKCDLVDQETKDASSIGFPITTLERIISDKDVRPFLGLKKGQDGELEFSIEQEEALKPISRVIKDLGNKTIKVDDVKNKSKRQKYISAFPGEDRADLKKQNIEGVPLRIDSKITKPKPSTNKPIYRPSKVENRNKVVLKGTNLPIDSKRFTRQQRVYKELRDLPLRNPKGEAQFPNAAVLLIRLFLEMTVDTYIEEKGLTHPHPKGWSEVSLVEKVKRVLKDLQMNNSILPEKAKLIAKACSDPNRLSYPGSLNDFAHNKSQVAAATDIISFWDTYIDFFMAIYLTLR
jgi:hypothetical protein